jgi:hypothetical protein
MQLAALKAEAVEYIAGHHDEIGNALVVRSGVAAPAYGDNRG